MESNTIIYLFKLSLGNTTRKASSTTRSTSQNSKEKEREKADILNNANNKEEKEASKTGARESVKLFGSSIQPCSTFSQVTKKEDIANTGEALGEREQGRHGKALVLFSLLFSLSSLA